jgi:ABC-type multidrug transport system fused ATPase/permease subunit
MVDGNAIKYTPLIIRYLRPYWKLATGSVLLIVLGAAAGLLSPWPLKILIDNVLESHPTPDFFETILGDLAQNRSFMLLLMVFAGLAIAVIQNGLSVLDNYINTRLDQSIVLDFRSDLFEHAQRLSLAFHDRRRSGGLIFAINNQGDAVARLIMTVPPLAQSVLTLLGMFWITFLMDWKLALVSLCILPFLYYSVGYYMKHIQKRLMEVRGMEGESLSIIHEAVSMIRVIVAFGREAYEHGRFRKQGEETVDARVNLTVRQTLFSLAVNTTTAAGTALVLGMGAYQVLQGSLTVGQLLVVMSYIASVYKPLEAISTTMGSLQNRGSSTGGAGIWGATPPGTATAPGAGAAMGAGTTAGAGAAVAGRALP